MVTTNLMTVEEFAAPPDDGWHYELIEGVPQRMPTGGYPHGRIGTRALVALWTFVAPRELGEVIGNETGFQLGEDPPVVRVPDVAFIRRERLPPPEQRVGYLRVAPDLVVEVRSPTDEPAAIKATIAFYQAVGVRLQWWIDPEARSVSVYRERGDPVVLGTNATLEAEELIPGFRLPVATLFA